MRRDVFQAIADPTRRSIINMIAHDSLNLNAVAEQFKVSRPAISRHIRILKECGLVSIKKKGRERYCLAQLERLNEVSQWVIQYRKFWPEKLDSLERYLSMIQPNETTGHFVSVSKKTRTGKKLIKKITAKRK